MKAIAMLNYVTKNRINGFVATFGKMRDELQFDVVCGSKYIDEMTFFVTEKPLEGFFFCHADVVFAKGDKIAFAYIIED